MEEEGFAHLFGRIGCASCSKAVGRRVREDPVYQEASKRYKELFDAIQEKLGEEAKLLLRMEEARSETMVLQEEWIYRQAFPGLFSLLQWMGAVRRE